MGLSGVALAAAGRHAGGGDLAQIASSFLLFHAAALIGLAAGLDRFDRWRTLIVLSGLMLTIGAAAFAGDLSLLAFGADNPVKVLAPVGGFAMLAGWLLLAVAPLLPEQHGR